MTNAVYGTFIPVYLDSIGYGQIAIGSLLAVGPFVSILAQPVWGTLGDRARSKNDILKILIFGSAVTVLMHRLSENYYYLLFIMAAFTFFQTSISPISDTITLESLDRSSWKFGPIRMAGTLGYALMAVIAGAYAKSSINGIFFLYFCIAIAAFLVTYRLPTVRGHQTKEQKVPARRLFKNKKLVVLMAFGMVLQITLGFYYSFYSLYLKQMGANNSLLGWAMFLSAISEVPFLIFADRILKKLGTEYTLLGSALAMGLRWFILYKTTDPYFALMSQLLHGINFIVLQYSMATYINETVPKELKAIGQTINTLFGVGISRIIGSFFGGFLSERFGIQSVFLYGSLLAFSAVFVFSFWLMKQRNVKNDC